MFQQVLDVDIYSPCFKFVKPMSSFEDKNINLPYDLKMDRLEENNIQQVNDMWFISFILFYSQYEKKKKIGTFFK